MWLEKERERSHMKKEVEGDWINAHGVRNHSSPPEEKSTLPQCFFSRLKNRDFPGGPVVLPCNAGDMGSIPGQGTKTSHAAEQLSPCHNDWTCTPQLESVHPHAAIKTGQSQTINEYFLKDWKTETGSGVLPTGRKHKGNNLCWLGI